MHFPFTRRGVGQSSHAMYTYLLPVRTPIQSAHFCSKRPVHEYLKNAYFFFPTLFNAGADRCLTVFFFFFHNMGTVTFLVACARLNACVYIIHVVQGVRKCGIRDAFYAESSTFSNTPYVQYPHGSANASPELLPFDFPPPSYLFGRICIARMYTGIPVFEILRPFSLRIFFLGFGTGGVVEKKKKISVPRPRSRF